MQNDHKTDTLLQDKNIYIIFGITLMAVMGVSSITPAFPKMMNVLNISPRSVGLLITVFTLPGVFLTPLLGILADRYGRKRILVPSLILFGLAGSACAFTQNFQMLLVLRFFQGAGAASLGSLNVTILSDLYTGHRRITAMGYNASVLSVGTAAYPALGGILAAFAWNFPFFLPLIAIPFGLFVLFYLKNPEPSQDLHLLEYLKNTFQCIKDGKALILFTISAVTFIILYGSYLTYFPLFVSLFFTDSPLIIGFLMAGMSLITALTSSQLGKISKHFSGHALLMISFFLYGLSLLILPFITHLGAISLPIILFGVAQGMNIPGIQTLLATLAPMEYRGAFMSFNGMVLRLGQTLGPLLMGLCYGLWGITGAFITGAVLAFIIVILLTVTQRLFKRG